MDPCTNERLFQQQAAVQNYNMFPSPNPPIMKSFQSPFITLEPSKSSCNSFPSLTAGIAYPRSLRSVPDLSAATSSCGGDGASVSSLFLRGAQSSSLCHEAYDMIKRPLQPSMPVPKVPLPGQDAGETPLLVNKKQAKRMMIMRQKRAKRLIHKIESGCNVTDARIGGRRETLSKKKD